MGNKRVVLSQNLQEKKILEKRWQRWENNIKNGVQ